MTSQKQRWASISKRGLGAANAALALAAVLGLGMVATQPALAQTFTQLYSFSYTDGSEPFASLFRDQADNLYGTTAVGGSAALGTVFKLDTSGNETVLYNFTGGADGGFPYGALVGDTAGNLYGTTAEGGDSSSYGVVFKLDSGGTETVLHTFTGGTTDGCSPKGGLLRDRAGNLYGTTVYCGAYGFGTVFKIDTGGTETVLHSFAGGSSDGAYPYYSILLMDTNGNLYGVTENGGGSANCNSGCGVVYRLSKSGKVTVLHSFAGGTTDGCVPVGTLTVDQDDNFYGTTNSCGSFNLGTVWKVSKGKETVLHNFAGGSSDGANPYAGVIMDAKGNLYGDTFVGGGTGCYSQTGCGTVYKLNREGVLTLLHVFVDLDGQLPVGGLIGDATGSLYGTAAGGGSEQCGTVWKLTR
jgi:uncharacterized repeat protein (TIGR03803 family)